LAWVCLRAGDPTYLIELLKSEFAGLDPTISLLLVSMLEKDGKFADFVIEIKKHPKLKRKSQSDSAKLEKIFRDQEICRWIKENGGLDKGQHEAAIQSAMDKYSRSRSTIQKIWGQHLKTLKIQRRQTAWLRYNNKKYGSINEVRKRMDSGEISSFAPDDFNPESNCS